MSAISASSFSFQAGRTTAFAGAQAPRGSLGQAQQTQRGFAPQQAQRVATFNSAGAVRGGFNAANNSSSFCPTCNSSSFCPTCNTAGGRQSSVTGSPGFQGGGQGGQICVGCAYR